jgi:GNAT superfamily N-acetyltransferase
MDSIYGNFRIELLFKHSELENAWGSPLLTASEKGYPKIFDRMVHWVLFADETAIAYTCSLLMPDKAYALVGNTYVRKEWRSKGLHTHLLNERNKSQHLYGVPLITVLNPIEKTDIDNLVKVVSKLGYERINEYLDVADIMPLSSYTKLDLKEHQELWRLNYGS